MAKRGGKPQRRLPAAVVERLEPGRRHVGAVRSGPRDAEVHAERKSELPADEPLPDGDGDGDDHRLGAEAEDQPAGRHHREERRQRRDDRADACR